MDIQVQLNGNMEFQRSTKSPEKGQVRFMGGSLFINEVPDSVPNGPIQKLTATANTWSDGSIRVQNWVTVDAKKA
jgi:hypothetical protein